MNSFPRPHEMMLTRSKQVKYVELKESSKLNKLTRSLAVTEQTMQATKALLANMECSMQELSLKLQDAERDRALQAEAIRILECELELERLVVQELQRRLS